MAVWWLLWLDENGIPETADGRLAVARKITTAGIPWDPEKGYSRGLSLHGGELR